VTLTFRLEIILNPKEDLVASFLFYKSVVSRLLFICGPPAEVLRQSQNKRLGIDAEQIFSIFILFLLCFFFCFRFFNVALLLGSRSLVVLDLDLAIPDLGLEILGVLAIDSAANGDDSTEYLENGAREVARHRAGAHYFGNRLDVLESDIAIVNH
jgi:hypothetical protein